MASKATTGRLQRELPGVLAACENEEEVKSEFARAFNLKLKTAKRMDLYTPQVLFEFKHQQNLQSLDKRSRVVAQLLYYVRELTFGSNTLSVPPVLCGVDKDEAFFVDTKNYSNILESKTKQALNFDWDRAPSTPCPNIVKAVAALAATKRAHVYDFQSREDWSNYRSMLESVRAEQFEFKFENLLKKAINEQNFEAAYGLWNEFFADYVQNGRKPSEYFAADIQQGKSVVLPDVHEVMFTISEGDSVRKSMPMDKYEHYWDTYKRCESPKIVHSIWQRLDRLTKEDYRRFTGEFYTPVEHAAKGLEYIERVVGKQWWTKGYRLWDMAAGTGNLEYRIPEEALPYCYISSLLADDVEYCKQLYPAATVFKYDYLNEDVKLLHGLQGDLDLDAWGITPKMPKQLYEDLRNPELKWIIFINPPFATSNDNSRTKEMNKDDVAKTAVREQMTAEGMGETSRELFSQFLWRIDREFKNREAHLGLFSKIKYVNANNDRKMRNQFFKYKFEAGFCFPAKAFHGTKGKFPIGFLVWNLNVHRPLGEQHIVLDIFDEQIDKVGTKVVPSNESSAFLSKWVPRFKNTETLPPLSAAITVAENKDSRNKVTKDFLCSLMAKGNEFLNQNYTALFSGPQASAGAFSITPKNFERAMVVHTVRRLPRATWLNDRDQWLAPTIELPDEFVQDCVVWSLFSTSNNTAAFTATFQNDTYHLKNELFPFSISDAQNWKTQVSSIANSAQAANKERFAANWLAHRKLSKEAKAVLTAAKTAYEFFYNEAAKTPHPKFKIQTWDVGWWQIKQALNEAELGTQELSAISKLHGNLGSKIYPQLTGLGFLHGGEHFFADDQEQVPT